MLQGQEMLNHGGKRNSLEIGNIRKGDTKDTGTTGQHHTGKPHSGGRFKGFGVYGTLMGWEEKVLGELQMRSWEKPVQQSTLQKPSG